MSKLREIVNHKEMHRMESEDKPVKQLIEELKEIGIISVIANGVSIQDTDFKILYQNQTAKDFLGDHVGKYCYKSYMRRTLACDDCSLRQGFSDGNVHKVEKSVATDKGVLHLEITVAPLRDSKGNIIAGIAVLKDITERKKIGEALKSSEKKYKDLVDNAIVGVYKTNINGDIFYVNKALSNIFEFESPEEMMSGGVLKLYKNPEDRKVLIENLKKTGKVNNSEVETVTKKGKPKIVLLNASLEGKFISGMIIDIADRRQIEKTLQKALDELEERIKERTKELEETNTALKILLRQREKDKSDLEENILSNIKLLILPYLAKLKSMKRSTSKELSYLNILGSNLKEIISPFSFKLSSAYIGLTPKEIQIANLIKDGKNNKDIVEMLNISFDTVKTHRQNIRKKLGISKKSINLRVCLLSLR